MLDCPEFWRGRNGEKIVGALLNQRGFFVIPSYDYSGEDDKAPRMHGPDTDHVLPDLDTARTGERYWAEVKTKAAPTLHRGSGVLEHGVSLRLWREYWQVQEITGCTVFLFVYEEGSGDVLARSLAKLDRVKRLYDGGKMGRHGMVFFPRSAFAVIANVGVAVAEVAA
jgi:hypothetical protein